MLNVKYFAYGSNIDIARLKGRVETWQYPVNAGVRYVLDGYKLVFNAGTPWSQWPYANIVPQIGSSVEGILYDLNWKQFEELDRYEALYHREFFAIDANNIGCVYVSNDVCMNPFVKPTLEYLNIIIDGCEATGLVRTFEALVTYKQMNYKLKKNRHKNDIIPKRISRIVVNHTP